MDTDRSSRLHLYEVMVLIAMGAMGFSIGRPMVLEMNLPQRNMWWLYRMDDWRTWYTVVCAAVTPVTVGLAGIGLVRRRGVSQVFCQPGMAGCGAAALGLALEGLRAIPLLLEERQWMRGPVTPWREPMLCVGYAVVGGWVWLAASGRWRWRRGWLEWLAVVVAVLWVIAAVGAAGANLVDFRRIIERGLRQRIGGWL